MREDRRDIVTGGGNYNENVRGNYIQIQQVTINEQNGHKAKSVQVDRLIIKLNGIDFDKFMGDQEIQKAVSLLLQKASGDTSVNFEKIEEGSIKITLNGSPEGLKKLAALIQSGELGELGEKLEELGLSIKDAKLLPKEKTGENENVEEHLEKSANSSILIVQTLEIYHHQPFKPRFMALAFQKLCHNHPEISINVISAEVKIKNQKQLLLRAQTIGQTNLSELRTEYFEIYNSLRNLPPAELSKLIAKNNQFLRLEQKVKSSIDSYHTSIRNINTGGGNYNERIEGNYNERIEGNYIQGNNYAAEKNSRGISKLQPRNKTLFARSDYVIDIFLWYSREDTKLMNELAKHLAFMRRQGLINTWYDHDISAGSEWQGQIDIHLNSAKIILLLISADFLASDYCFDVELERAIERHEAGEAVVIPVILRPVDWQNSKFSKLQVLPNNAKPITHWEDRDEGFLDVVKGICRAIDALDR